VATLVARLAQQLAVLLLGHALAALLDHRAHWLNVSFVSWMSCRPSSAREGDTGQSAQPIVRAECVPNAPGLRRSRGRSPPGTPERPSPAPGRSARPARTATLRSAPNGRRSS